MYMAYAFFSMKQQTCCLEPSGKSADTDCYFTFYKTVHDLKRKCLSFCLVDLLGKRKADTKRHNYQNKGKGNRKR